MEYYWKFGLLVFIKVRVTFWLKLKKKPTILLY